ncbi:Zn-dependent exopeptidase [Schizophyllum commune Tattone D]|nr:Zn-dependent exopeptidase [Schizophyllum commune Tattone D]
MKGLFALALLSSTALAAPAIDYHVDGQTVLSKQPGFSLDLTEQRLVLLEGDATPRRVSELEKIHLKAQGINFFDVTETPDLSAYAANLQRERQALPKPNATDLVFPIIKSLSTDGPKANLAKFTSFRTRYYRSDTGKQSQQWLLSRISEITDEFAPDALRDLITFKEFPHSWGQNSIIVRIEGSTKPDEVVIVSAHQDSTNMWPFLPAPGADDDGSGTVTILEAYRGLIAAGFQPDRTVEFHWYSAEEGGLLGSQAVAKDYAAKQANVIASSQFDMTAWVKRGTREEVGIITDFVDEEVSNFNKALVDLYLAIPYVETQCGYACSDHASWTQAGYPSSFTIESTFQNSNKNIHSTNDRSDISDEFSFEHILEFSKLATAFAVELGGWSKKQ